MIVLGIETSCDETSASLVDDTLIKSNIIATQHIHEQYGGVVPEFASRAHIQKIVPIVQLAVKNAGISYQEIDSIAVTHGPGLAGSLLVGMCFAKSLALRLNIPFIGVNHIEGHLLAVHANEQDIQYPAIGLVASGGHTILVHIKSPLEYKIIGQTIDDAAGEAFDKVAKIIGLGYPGGPAVENSANQGDPNAIYFPRALLEKNNFNFSFSGLKTSVLYYIESEKRKNNTLSIPNICASFQNAVIDVLLKKSIQALEQFNCSTLILAGGVVRNNTLRKTFKEHCENSKVNFYVPDPELCTDNAAMIARAGYYHLKNGELSDFELDAVPNLALAGY